MLTIFQYPFMQNALLVALFLGISCALLSCFLVLKGWALLADAISHAILLGVVIAQILAIPLSIGALGAALSCAFTTSILKKYTILRSDTLLGIVFSSFFALGILLSENAQHLTHLLFGNLLGINASQRLQIIFLSVLVSVILLIKWRDFSLFIFDPLQAKLSALSPNLLQTILLILLTLIAVAAMQAVGVILVVSMLIAPACSALLVVKRFSHLLILAVLLSVLASCGGVILSFYLNSSTSATIVLLQGLLFFLMLLLRGILQWQKQKK